MTPWTPTLPTEAGVYLFYGDLSPRPRYSRGPKYIMVRANLTANGVLMYFGDGQFLNDCQWYGVFRPFDEAPPNLDDFDLSHQKGA